MLSPNYYFCSLCAQAKPYYTFRQLFQHLQYVHNGESNFTIRREVGPLCGGIYSTFAGYKAHIYREHTALLNDDLNKQGIPIDTNTHDDETSSATYHDAHFDFDTETNDIEDEQNETERETDDEDVISWTSLKGPPRVKNLFFFQSIQS
jgi:hypothetical protein